MAGRPAHAIPIDALLDAAFRAVAPSVPRA